MYCSYFQARVVPHETWFFVATLRSNDHLSFDRTLDPATGLFEFYVPHAQEELFVKLMNYYEKLGIISGFVKKENRLAQDGAVL